MVATSLTLLPLAQLGRPPSFDQVIALAPWLVLAAAGFLIPVMWGVYWGSRNVDPGRLGILLQIEAVAGITSAALLRRGAVRRAAGHRGRPRDRRRSGGGHREQTGGGDRGGAVILPLSCL